ncbi:MAG: alpha-amylase family glycosyl hydrolase [Candidatus Borkfalkiaceae bacterium]|nr:alpha-amylase family glycosyl hydrolase [Christensenellaceae bacterium]
MTELFYVACRDFLSNTAPGRGEEVAITVRVRGRGKVYLEYTEELFNLSENRYERIGTETEKRKGEYEYRTARIVLGDSNVRFHFLCEEDGESFLYDARGRAERADKTKDFILTPGFDTPGWSKGALWYQIMPDSFYNGNVFNDKGNSGLTTENAWGNGHYGGGDYFGGDFDGVVRKLDYLSSLGVTAISLNPVWASTHNAGYGADDLTDVDACFGGDEGLKKLVGEVHRRGMKICLDGVFDYIVPKGKWYNEDGLYPLPGGKEKGDPYYGIFLRDLCGKTIPSFWGQPLIDFSSDFARELIYEGEDSVVKTYLKEPYSIDAWRMDVGNIYEGSDPEHFGNSVDVMRDMRKNIKEVNPDALLITENDLPKMRTYAVNDSKWNYELGVPLRDWAAGKITETAFRAAIDENTRSLPVAIAGSCFNHVTTHDTPRIADTANGDRAAIIAATVFMMGFVGSPSIYFGDENGERGKPYPSMGLAAPVSFGSMDWYPGHRDEEIFSVYSALGKERASDRAFYAEAGYEIVFADDGKKVLVFVRFSGEKLKIVATNRSETACRIFLDLSAYSAEGDFKDILSGNVASFRNGKGEITVFPGGSFFAESGDDRLIDGFICDCVSKTENGAYRIGKRLAFQETGYFAFRLEGDFGSGTEIFVGKTSVSVLREGVSVDGRKVLSGRPQHVEIRREENTEIFADGRQVFCDGKRAPSSTEIAVLSADAVLSVARERKGTPKKVDYSEDGGGFFSCDVGVVENGRLVLQDEETTLPVPSDDFTFTAGIASGEGGIFVTDGVQRLSFGIRGGVCSVTVNGVPFGEGKPDGRIRALKAEKCGTRYRLIALGDRPTVVAEDVRFNLSELFVGLFAAGRCEFLSAFFGDGSVCLRRYLPDEYPLSAEEYAESLTQPRYEIGKGEFLACYGGWSCDTEGESKTSFSGLYGDFTLQFSLESEGADFAAEIGKTVVEVARAREGKTAKREMLFLRRKTSLFLFENGLFLRKTETEDGRLSVGFVGKGKYRLTNVAINRTGRSWTVGRGKSFPMREGFDLSAEWLETAYLCYGKAVQNFAFSVNAKFNRSASVDEGFFSVGFGGKAGSIPESEGVFLRFYKETEKAELLAGGKVLAEKRISAFDNESFYFVLVNVDGRVKVYCAPNENEKKCTLLLDCDTGMKEGGCLSVYNRHTRVFLCDAKLISVRDFSDAEEQIANVRIAPSKHRYMI